MPCYDPYEAAEKNAALDALPKIRSELNTRTNMLCHVLTQWEGFAPLSKLHPDVQRWWEEHKKWDMERCK